MAEIRSGKEKREVIENRPNEVISVAEVKLLMFRFTDKDGFVDNGLAFCFGKDVEDAHKPGVYAISGQDLGQLLKIPHKYVKEGVRRFLEASEQEAELEDGGELPDFSDHG